MICIYYIGAILNQNRDVSSRNIPLFAPKMVYLQGMLRAVVSIPKQTVYDVDSWLDLSHITTQLIVAAGPTDNVITGMFRSPLERVVLYLETYHQCNGGKNWHIWNFRAEGVGYDLDPANCTYRPFPDHEPPSVVFLIRIVDEISSFLHAAAGNVALIHCKEGKGRSGTVCCAYLMSEAKCYGTVMSTTEAIAAFTRKRMRRNFGPGVSIRSQVRYLEYYSRFLNSSEREKRDFWAFHSQDDAVLDGGRSYIDKITIYGWQPLLMLSSLDVSTYTEDEKGLSIVTLIEKNLFCLENLQSENVQLDLSLDHKVKDIRLSFGRKVCYAYSWFNLYYETQEPEIMPILDKKVRGRITIDWADFDGLYGFRISSSMKLFDKIQVSWVLQRD